MQTELAAAEARITEQREELDRYERRLQAAAVGLRVGPWANTA
jgi:hypothetical protein